MQQAFIRKPIGNFFIKKSLQMRLIAKIVGVVLFSTIVCVLSLLLIFYVRYKSSIFYHMDLDGNLTKQYIVSLLMPSLLVSAVVNILVGLGVGMYASRKYAVPIYKLEQWATLLLNGHLNAKLIFREKEEMKELSDHCNALSDTVRKRFAEIKKQVIAYKENKKPCEEIEAIEKTISDLELQTGLIDVTTGFYSLGKKDEDPATDKPAA
jgi:methyl-accepting chemotaxis protein